MGKGKGESVVNPKMNTARLIVLADFLDTIPKKKFNLRVWMNEHLSPTRDRNKFPNAFTTLSEVSDALQIKPVQCVEPNVCQTAGCAIGWATTIPAFKRAGLRLIYNYDSGAQETYPAIVKNGKVVASWFGAAQKLFGLTKDEAKILFDWVHYSSSDPSPKTVSKRIRKVIDKEKFKTPGGSYNPDLRELI